MSKDINVTVDGKNEFESPAFTVFCKGCNGDRFQVHERGTLTRGGDTISVNVSELAIQCLDCHKVEVVPVSGHVEYYA